MTFLIKRGLGAFLNGFFLFAVGGRSLFLFSGDRDKPEYQGLWG